jgi:hypothetical protein
MGDPLPMTLKIRRIVLPLPTHRKSRGTRDSSNQWPDVQAGPIPGVEKSNASTSQQLNPFLLPDRITETQVNGRERVPQESVRFSTAARSTGWSQSHRCVWEGQLSGRRPNRPGPISSAGFLSEGTTFFCTSSSAVV